MSTFTIARNMILFVDEKRRVALVQLPREAFPPECHVGTPYGADIEGEGDSGPTEWKIAFQVTGETLSFGRKVPPLAWVCVLGIERAADLLGKTYRVRDTREATPAEVENVREILAVGSHRVGSVN